ncbi:MAG: hypothetical protein J6M35_01560 [Clostridia bacterium]|nr:hypothetical protein [Clostridia bacterium]
MIIIHAYFKEYTDRLLESGIAQKGDGFKINQMYRAPEELKFNIIAKKGGAFFNLVKDCASCFYVDRLQGGVFYSRYDFSKDLIDTYARETDAEFLGIQVHELGNTRGLDWKRIQKCLAAENLEWTEENIYNSVRKISADKNFPHFSQGPASEYAALTPPKTVTEFVNDLDYVLSERQKSTWGNVLKCDDGFMYCRSEERHKIRNTFIEVGGQRPQIRLQFALRRGLSRSTGKKWGTYIEPWGGKECTTYVYERDGANDWFRPRLSEPMENRPFLHTVGEKGGTSISLAGRLMFYALFAGSDYFAEEWGAGNTFYSWEEGGLTPYGIFKKKMADLSRKLTKVKAVVPIAIILPKQYQLVLTHGGNISFENDAIPGAYPDIVRKIHKLFYNGNMLGTEDNLMTVGRYGSLFDIIYEDTYEHPEKEYEFLVDFSGKFAGSLDVAANAYEENELYARLDRFISEYLPFSYVSKNDIDYTLFENDGKKYCAFFNHSGLSKSVAEGESINPDSATNVKITMKNANIAEVFDICEIGYSLYEGNRIDVRLGGGEFILFRYE